MIEALEKELSQLLNKYSVENESNTPDFILARYLSDCLEAFRRASLAKDWHERKELVDQLPCEQCDHITLIKENGDCVCTFYGKNINMKDSGCQNIKKIKRPRDNSVHMADRCNIDFTVCGIVSKDIPDYLLHVATKKDAEITCPKCLQIMEYNYEG